MDYLNVSEASYASQSSNISANNINNNINNHNMPPFRPTGREVAAINSWKSKSIHAFTQARRKLKAKAQQVEKLEKYINSKTLSKDLDTIKLNDYQYPQSIDSDYVAQMNNYHEGLLFKTLMEIQSDRLKILTDDYHNFQESNTDLKLAETCQRDLVSSCPSLSDESSTIESLMNGLRRDILLIDSKYSSTTKKAQESSTKDGVEAMDTDLVTDKLQAQIEDLKRRLDSLTTADTRPSTKPSYKQVVSSRPSTPRPSRPAKKTFQDGYPSRGNSRYSSRKSSPTSQKNGLRVSKDLTRHLENHPNDGQARKYLSRLSRMESSTPSRTPSPNSLQKVHRSSSPPSRRFQPDVDEEGYRIASPRRGRRAKDTRRK
jgi:ribosomal protein S15P/S13E